MASHPNFPEFLDIAPSRIPNTLSTQLHDTFRLHAQEEAIRMYGIAGRVWEAAYALSLYVQPAADLEFDPPFISSSDRKPVSMIELGSGAGLVAAAIANKLESPDDLLIATDLPEVCQLLHANLRSNSSPLLAVRPLAWGNIQHASNVTSELLTVYFPNLFAPLLRSLIHLTSLPSSETPKIIMSYKIRSLSKEMPFWSAFGLWFEFSPVLARRRQGTWSRFTPSGSDDVVFIFIARRRPESFQWEIPTNDSDLLTGWQTGTKEMILLRVCC
ncbi:putative methyltransferase-domain-containing protein [Amanita rubescens]|nr:putative methyltransferase-domain-containing protein [Amanita rubescens]